MIEGEDCNSAVTVEGNAGNDLINLLDPIGADNDISSPYFLDRAEISGGAGDDDISAVAGHSTVSGGDGDDKIDIRVAGGSSIFGDDGNDVIRSTLTSQDLAFVDGGAGDDLIDVSEMENVIANGGVGKDLIRVSGGDQSGAGYVIRADGGEGEDMIAFDGSLADVVFPRSAQTALGGPGSDDFSVRFDAGIDLQEGTEIDGTFELFHIDDFAPDDETLLLEPYSENPDDEFTQAELIENTETGQTRVVMTFDMADGTSRQVTVTLNAVGVDWDDITFAEGSEPQTMVPLP